jgi:hypothetical protein
MYFCHNTKQHKRHAVFIGFYLLLSLFIVSSCTPGLYGNLQWSDDVLESFESAHILENHTYYYFGPEMQPDAIIAIDNKYTLAPSLWKKINLTSSQLGRWMERIDNQHRYRYERFQGADIIDHQGKQVGVWYSRSEWTVIRQGQSDNEVVIFTPDTSKFYFRAGGERGPDWK